MDEIIHRRPDNENVLYTKRLNERLRRALKLLDLKAPKVVIANEVWLVFLAGIGYCGEYLVIALHHWILARMREKCNYCGRCGAALKDKNAECKECKKDEADFVSDQWDLSDNIKCKHCKKTFTYSDLVGKTSDQCPFCGRIPYGT